MFCAVSLRFCDFYCFARIFTRRAALRARTSQKSCFLFCNERLKNKTKCIICLYSTAVRSSRSLRTWGGGYLRYNRVVQTLIFEKKKKNKFRYRGFLSK